MIKELIVRFVPTTIHPTDVQGRCVVMADILRASTTIVQALASGANAVFPQAEIEDSQKLARELGQGTLVGGERNGQIVPGFDQGNSPLEYTPEIIGGKNLVLCTTNGTYTLTHCRSASRVLIGAFVNLTAICQQLAEHESAMIACAGTNRSVTDEDVLFAGAVASKLQKHNAEIYLNDAARIAAARWESMQSKLANEPLWKIFALSHGGRNLMRLGYEHDVKFCAEIDMFSVVPELDLEKWVITTASWLTNAAEPTSQN